MVIRGKKNCPPPHSYHNLKLDQNNHIHSAPLQRFLHHEHLQKNIVFVLIKCSNIFLLTILDKGKCG